MSHYLLEVAVVHTLLILGYFLLLRKERQFGTMRFFLVGSTLLALVIPLLNISIPSFWALHNTPINTISPAISSSHSVQFEQMAAVASGDHSLWDLMIWPYLIISGILLLNFCRNVWHLFKLASNSRTKKVLDQHIKYVEHIQGSFTFFNWIFFSSEKEKNQPGYDVILKHEKAHVTLGHSYDLILFELFKIFFWWLPTAWFVLPEIKKIHEYQADAEVLKLYPLEQYSSILINATLKSNGVRLASSFHEGFILKRIQTMKQKTVRIRSWKLGTLTVLIVSLFLVFACSQETNSDVGAEVFTVVEEHPEFVGGMDAFYNYIRQEIRYPLEARQSGVEGTVDVQFVVEKDGSLSGAKAVNGIGSGCDREAERVIENAPLFKPGKQRGKALRVKMTMPIVFKLDHGKKNADNSTQGMIVVKDVELKKGKLKVDAKYKNGAWSGTVRDEKGNELPGTNIVVAGTSAGTVSDLDGAFTIKAPKNAELHISFVGYESVQLSEK